MRRILLIGVMLLFALVSTAYAGILDKIFEGGIETVVSLTISGLFVVIGLFFRRALQWRTATNEGVSVVMAVYAATRPGSSGGARITQAELDKILAETSHFGTAFASAWANAKVSR